ncbi:MAG: 30S ribosome-binding factor RbfA [Tagaea sp.]|nr:30S ribosome-binding factor RbfA [Azospirillum sp.]MCA3268018.1 30S ribosome-binding factor RbfA [Azospirillum sp.]MCZ8123715.1 30S ribosome-binding factor RbfA [Magnetospirillum sp.]
MSNRFRETDREGPSQRQLRVGEAIRRALVEVLQEAHFRDPDLQDASITVSEVRASPDLKHASVFVTTLGGIESEKTIAALGRARAFLKGEVQRRVDLRQACELHFQKDTSFDYASRMEAAFRSPRVAADIVPPEPEKPKRARKKK